MTTPTITELVRNGNHVGQRVALARYHIPAGERVLHGQRINGVVRVTDNPAGGRGRAYLVERELERDGNAALQALLADYVEQAERQRCAARVDGGEQCRGALERAGLGRDQVEPTRELAAGGGSGHRRRGLLGERLRGRAKRLHRRKIDELPDGAFVALEGAAFAVRGDALLRWTPEGYDARKPRPRRIAVDVLTPPAILAILSAGYQPRWHPSAKD